MVYTTGLSANAEQAILVVIAETPPSPCTTRSSSSSRRPLPDAHPPAHRPDARSSRSHDPLATPPHGPALAVTRASAGSPLVLAFSANAANAPNAIRGPPRGPPRGRAPAPRSSPRAPAVGLRELGDCRTRKLARRLALHSQHTRR
ncbi:hypothetical protein EV121DRAFT_297095 [Schizophyllum commune]